MKKSHLWFVALVILAIGGFWIIKDSGYEVVSSIPPEMQGRWTRQYENYDWKISANQIRFIDNTTSTTDTRTVRPVEIRRTGRANCSNCAEWGIEVVTPSSGQHYNLYLNNFNEATGRYEQLKVVPSMPTAHTSTRVN
jgi:hypothetical protein